MPMAIFLIVFLAPTSILFIVKVKIILSIFGHVPPPLSYAYVDGWAYITVNTF